MEHEEENFLLEQVLDVLAHLVSYGYYDDVEDVDEAMVPLIQMLNGKTDLPSVSRRGKCRHNTASLAEVVTILLDCFLVRET